MAIQQVASGSSKGVMSFLFQDDGGTEGLVLEGEGFAVTLRQLLADADARPESADAAGVSDATTALTAPLSAELDTLASDFALPAHSAALPAEAGWEGAADGQEVEEALLGIAPFTNVMATMQEHRLLPQPDEATTATAAAQEHSPVKAPAVPVFGNGIEHLIALARDVQDAAAALTPQHAQPGQPLIKTTGRNLPGSGKVLPQGVRPSALGQVIDSMQARQGRGAPASEALLIAAGDTAANSAFGGFSAELPNTEPRAQTSAAAPATTIIQGLRGENTLPALPKATAESMEAPATPQFQSEYTAGTDAWFDDLAARVEWLQDMNIEQADLKLHPAELGLLEIHISAADDGATVSFVTHNAQARELIEDSMPKLRELLANQGMQLGDSQVSQHSAGQQREQELNSPAARARDEEPAPLRRRAYVADPNRIDHYV